jgi:RNA polymerase sigma-70 factor (ECF subfamily)
MSPESDDVLAARSRKGDPQALASLYRHHAPSLLGYLERLLGERTDAEDVLHETFLRVFEGRGRYRGRGRFRGWLYTVATRLARDRLKQRRRRGELIQDALEKRPPLKLHDPERDTEQREILRRVESVLGDLPPAYVMAFHLRVREELTYREMATICGESEGTLRSRVHHALIRIRRTLEEGAPSRGTPPSNGRMRDERTPSRRR